MIFNVSESGIQTNRKTYSKKHRSFRICVRSTRIYNILKVVFKHMAKPVTTNTCIFADVCVMQGFSKIMKELRPNSLKPIGIFVCLLNALRDKWFGASRESRKHKHTQNTIHAFLPGMAICVSADWYSKTYQTYFKNTGMFEDVWEIQRFSKCLKVGFKRKATPVKQKQWYVWRCARSTRILNVSERNIQKQNKTYKKQQLFFWDVCVAYGFSKLFKAVFKN